jgi:hypothetical protein
VRVGPGSTLGELFQAAVDLGSPCGVPRGLAQGVAVVRLQALVERDQELLSILVAERERVAQDLFDPTGGAAPASLRSIATPEV